MPFTGFLWKGKHFRVTVFFLLWLITPSGISDLRYKVGLLNKYKNKVYRIKDSTVEKVGWCSNKRKIILGN